MSQQINLFNPIFLKQKKYFSAVTMLQGLGLIALVATAFYGYAVYQVSQLSSHVVETDQMLRAGQARLVKLSGEFSPQRRSALLQEEIKRLEARLKDRQGVVETLKSGALGNTEGYSEYMRAFARQSVDGVWLTGFNISGAGNEIAITGRALQPDLVPAYLRRLNREPVLQGRRFAALQLSLPKEEPGKGKSVLPYIEFSLQSGEPGTSK